MVLDETSGSCRSSKVRENVLRREWREERAERRRQVFQGERLRKRREKSDETMKPSADISQHFDETNFVSNPSKSLPKAFPSTFAICLELRITTVQVKELVSGSNFTLDSRKGSYRFLWQPSNSATRSQPSTVNASANCSRSASGQIRRRKKIL